MVRRCLHEPAAEKLPNIRFWIDTVAHPHRLLHEFNILLGERDARTSESWMTENVPSSLMWKVEDASPLLYPAVLRKVSRHALAREEEDKGGGYVRQR